MLAVLANRPQQGRSKDSLRLRACSVLNHHPQLAFSQLILASDMCSRRVFSSWPLHRFSVKIVCLSHHPFGSDARKGCALRRGWLPCPICPFDCLPREPNLDCYALLAHSCVRQNKIRPSADIQSAIESCEACHCVYGLKTALAEEVHTTDSHSRGCGLLESSKARFCMR